MICFEGRRNFILISKGNKGFAFVNFIASRYARRTGRDHLRPKAPPRRVPWPESINVLSLLKSASIDTSRLRADCVRPAETCEKSSAELFSVCSGTSQTATETRIRRRRADMQSIVDVYLRANKQIQTDMPPER